MEPPYFVGREGDLKWLLERLKLGEIASITAIRGSEVSESLH